MHRLLPSPKSVQYLPDEAFSLSECTCVSEVLMPQMPHEAYALTIKNDEVCIKAASAAGFSRSRQTLRQVIHSQNSLRPMLIEDSPAMSFRGVAVDLRYQTFNMDYLVEKISEWAGWKINAVLIDYGGEFPYGGELSRIPSATAFSMDEIEMLLACCKQHFIDVIPCVQTFGHMEYLLTHEDFRHLSELPDRFSQICPLNPPSIEVVRELLTQSYNAHGKPRYLSVGGDEAMHLGKCPKCQEYVAKHGKSGLYIYFINQVLEHVHKLGAIPILYADMVLADTQSIDDLGDCILADWDYWTLDSPPDKIMDWRAKKMISVEEARTCENLANIADELIDGSSKAFHPFAYTKWLISRGRRVIGAASTASTGPDDNWTPNYNVHIPNIVGFAQAAKAYGAKGLLITAWERHLMETISYGIAAGADVLWSGAVSDDLPERFGRVRFDFHDGNLSRKLAHAMHRLSAPYTFVEKKWPLVYIPHEFGRGAISLEQILKNNDIDENLEFASSVFSNTMELARLNAYELRQWLFGCKMKRLLRDAALGNDCGDEIHRLKIEALDMLICTMPEPSASRRIAASFAVYGTFVKS